MRYGRVKAEGGPAGGAVGPEASPSAGLGEGEGALVMGGGSIDECDVGGLDGMTGSGNDGISSSIFEVSIVICLVGGAA
jgi:hypothetical protein